jgi:hypothetical protein|tara:strand:- start:1085 stop:1321 length:237 start_codon:yes stop_codon:yes gene_type:complete
MSILENLASEIESRRLAIEEIESMLEEVTLSRQNIDLARYSVEIMKRERLELIAKEVTLQNLHFYREMKEENDLPKRS